MNSDKEKPFPEEIKEAKRYPNGRVYRIAGKFLSDERTPREAIVGAWKVDSRGNIIDDFIKNKNYDPKRWPTQKAGEQ